MAASSSVLFIIMASRSVHRTVILLTTPPAHASTHCVDAVIVRWLAGIKSPTCTPISVTRNLSCSSQPASLSPRRHRGGLSSSVSHHFITRQTVAHGQARHQLAGALRASQWVQRPILPVSVSLCMCVCFTVKIKYCSFVEQVVKKIVKMMQMCPDVTNQKAPQGGCGHRRQHARLR